MTTGETKHKNGKPMERWTKLPDGRLHGPLQTFYESGQLQEFTNYLFGIADGNSFSWTIHGQLFQQLQYRAGKFHGHCRYFSFMTKQWRDEYFIDGQIVSQEQLHIYWNAKQ